MLRVGVLAPRSAVAIADVHGGRFNGNPGTGWNSGVDGNQAGFLQREACPRFHDNAFIEHAIQHTDQVIGIGDKGAHWNLHPSRMPGRGPVIHLFVVFLGWLRRAGERLCKP